MGSLGPHAGPCQSGATRPVRWKTPSAAKTRAHRPEETEPGAGLYLGPQHAFRVRAPRLQRQGRRLPPVAERGAAVPRRPRRPQMRHLDPVAAQRVLDQAGQRRRQAADAGREGAALRQGDPPRRLDSQGAARRQLLVVGPGPAPRPRAQPHDHAARRVARAAASPIRPTPRASKSSPTTPRPSSASSRPSARPPRRSAWAATAHPR